jgi:hypothetical protein
MGRAIGRKGWREAFLAVCVVVVVVIACTSCSATIDGRVAGTAGPADQDTAPPSSMDHGNVPMDHDNGHGNAAPAALDGSTPCEQAAAVTPALAQGGAAHGHFGPVVEQPLEPSVAAELEHQLAAARTFVAGFPTAADALAGGYAKGVPYLPCIAAHYTNRSYRDGRFDPAQPEQLLYGGNGADAPLVGVSYLVLSGANPPDGFAGPNDEWHQHIGLCLRNDVVIGGTGLSDEQCTERGGRKTVSGEAWMLHVWLVPGHESSWGMFSGENPLLGLLPATPARPTAG